MFYILSVLACLLVPRTSPAASPEESGSHVYCENVNPLLGDVAMASGLMTRFDIEKICAGEVTPVRDLLGTENYTREVAAYLAFHFGWALGEAHGGKESEESSSFVLIRDHDPKDPSGTRLLASDPPQAVSHVGRNIATHTLERGVKPIGKKKEQGYVLDHDDKAYVVFRIPYEYTSHTAAAEGDRGVVHMPWYKGRSRDESNVPWDPPPTRCVDIRTQASDQKDLQRKWTFLINGVPISDNDYPYQPGATIKVIFPTSGRDDSVHLRALADDGTISREVQLTLSSTSECTVWRPDMSKVTERDDVYGLVDLSDDGSCDGRISQPQIREAVKQYFGRDKVVDVDLPVQAALRLSEIDEMARKLGQPGQLVEDHTELGLQAGARVADFARWLRNESFGRPLLLEITCKQDDTIELSGMSIDLPNLSNIRTESVADMVRSESVLVHSQEDLRDGVGRLLATLSDQSMAWIARGERRLDYYSEHLLSYHVRSEAETGSFRPSIRIAYVPNERQAQMVCDSVAEYNRLDMIEQGQILEFVDIFSPSGRVCDDSCIGVNCVTKRWFERCESDQRGRRLEGNSVANTGPYPVLVFEAEFCSAQDKKSCIAESDDIKYFAIHDGDATGAVPFAMSRPGRYVAWITWDGDGADDYHPISITCFEAAEDRVHTSPWNLWMEVGSMVLPRAPGPIHSGELGIFQGMIGVGHDWGALRRGTWRAGLGYHQWRRTFTAPQSWDNAGELLDATGNDGRLREPLTYVRRAITLRTSVGFRFDAWGCWPRSWERLEARVAEELNEDEWRPQKRSHSSNCALPQRRAVTLELLGGAGLSAGFYDIKGAEPWTEKIGNPSSGDFDFEVFAGFRLRGPIAAGFGAYGFFTVGASDLDSIAYPHERGLITNNFSVFPLVGFGVDKQFKGRE